MDLSILSNYDMEIAVEKAITEVFNAVKKRGEASFVTHFEFDPAGYESFCLNEIEQSGPVIKIGSSMSEIHLMFPEVAYNATARGTFRTTEFQIWGTVLLKKDYGHVFIRTETFLDKIHELINPIELDFEDDKEFSKTFFVLTTDKQKTELQLTPLFRKLMMEIPLKDIMIEISGNRLITGNKKVIQTDTAVAFTKFLESISKVF